MDSTGLLLLAANISGILLLAASVWMRVRHSFACRRTTAAFHIQAAGLLLLSVAMIGRWQYDGTLFELLAAALFIGLLWHATLREHRRRQVLLALHTGTADPAPHDGHGSP